MIKITRICRTCKCKFYIMREDANWLRKKGLELYSHCEECRKERREKK